MKKFNVDTAIQEIANHFKTEILKGNFTTIERGVLNYVSIGKYEFLISYLIEGNEIDIIGGVFAGMIKFNKEEKKSITIIIKEKQAELKELEKVNLAKEIEAKQRLLDSM